MFPQTNQILQLQKRVTDLRAHFSDLLPYDVSAVYRSWICLERYYVETAARICTETHANFLIAKRISCAQQRSSSWLSSNSSRLVILLSATPSYSSCGRPTTRSWTATLSLWVPCRSCLNSRFI